MFCVLNKEIKIRKLEIGDGVVVKMHASTLASFGTKESFFIMGTVVNICWSKGEGTQIRSFCVVDEDNNLYVIRYQNQSVLVYTDNSRELYTLDFAKLCNCDKKIQAYHEEGCFGVGVEEEEYIPLEVGTEIKHSITDRIFTVAAVNASQFVVQAPDTGFIIYNSCNASSHFDGVQFRL